VKQKIPLKDKKIRTPMNGKFNDIGSANLVIKYLCINLQNQNKKLPLYSIYLETKKKDITFIYR
jgi:hypothetical protein